MNARLFKETRELLPAFASTLLLIVLPHLIRPWLLAELEVTLHAVSFLALVVACAVMGGSSFGSEFQHRTLSLLLSQPIARSVLWREKMLVVGVGMAASLAVLVGCCPVRGSADWLALALIPLCAFCGAPYWTLRLRHGIGGMVFAAAAPGCIIGFTALVAEWFSMDAEIGIGTGIVFVILYCAVACWRGYVRFNRLEAVDGPESRELRLPGGLELVLTRPLAGVSSRFRGPFATLLKKELRLQQISFLLAGLFGLVAVAGCCLMPHYRNLGEGMLGADCGVYVILLPLVAGAMAVAEEKGWELAEWQRTLPPSVFQQWAAKMLAAISTSLALGLLLPAALFLVGDRLFGAPGPKSPLPPVYEFLPWVLSQMLVTSVAVYAASFCKSTLRAILAAFGIVAAGCGAFALLASGTEETVRRVVAWIGPLHVGEGLLRVGASMVVPLLSVALGFVLCLVQWFAWSNFRRYRPSPLRVLIQLAVVFLSVWLVSVAILTLGLVAYADGDAAHGMAVPHPHRQAVLPSRP
jgi:ABC-type transport system involved in multi-copper enzyme maturation permease subunit